MAMRSRSGPLPWTNFFDQDLYLERQMGDVHLTHHVYLTPHVGSGPLFVTHHGAGSSGLSFATLAAELKKRMPNAGILSPDARAHGETTVRKTTVDGTEPALDLTLSTLSDDLAFVVKATQARMHWAELPNIILVGHSLGGAVVTNVAFQNLLGPAVVGYAVLDVVEGSAMDALQSMESYLSTRPKSFPSVAAGITWHTRSRTIRNANSARASVPALLWQDSSKVGPAQWTWRTDLAATKPFWEDWFVGLSNKFLAGPGGKLLLLAGTDRLDKELIIGQMQGKYQLEVFPDAGHFIHEDQPVKAAEILADFYGRNDRSALVLPPKVDELIRLGKLKKPKVGMKPPTALDAG